MAADPEGNQEQLRFIPSERLIAMFRLVLQSQKEAVVFVGNLRVIPLYSYSRDCSRDPAETIKARLRSMLQTFLQHFRDNEGNEIFELAVKCCREAKIFYYNILESSAIEERSKRSTNNISDVFECDLFQRCLVVCCLEISIFSNRVPCDFPLVLQILKMAPYHFWRVIKVVVRADVIRTPTVVRHLAEVEDKVLKSLAWTSDSPLWEDIRAIEGRLPTCLQVLPPAQLEEPMTADSQSDGSQPRGAGPSARANQQQSPSAGNPPQRSKSLHLFTRKVYSLMGRRLNALCPTLHICDEQRLKIWTCFEHCLVHCTDLMMDRHLDQILMCTIYIIGKVTGKEIPFSEIKRCYELQPLSSENSCNPLISEQDTENCPTGSRDNGEHNHGFLTPNTPSTHSPPPWHEETDNLKRFYNQVYSARLQHFASQFAPTPSGITPPLSPYPRQRTASPSRHRLSSGQSIIFISPLNAEATPRSESGICYHFNTSPSERLREINKMIRVGLASSSGCYAIGRDEEEEEEEEHPPARRLRLDESALQRRLRNLENDRLATRNEGRASPVKNGLPPDMH